MYLMLVTLILGVLAGCSKYTYTPVDEHCEVRAKDGLHGANIYKHQSDPCADVYGRF